MLGNKSVVGSIPKRSWAIFSFLRIVVQKFDTLDVLVSRITIAKGTSLSRLNVIKLFGVEILKI